MRNRCLCTTSSASYNLRPPPNQLRHLANAGRQRNPVSPVVREFHYTIVQIVYWHKQLQVCVSTRLNALRRLKTGISTMIDESRREDVSFWQGRFARKLLNQRKHRPKEAKCESRLTKLLVMSCLQWV